jgi:hypothetical protein
MGGVPLAFLIFCGGFLDELRLIAKYSQDSVLPPYHLHWWWYQ